MRSLALLCVLALATPEAYTKSFAREAKSQSWFAAVLKNAQSQIDLLPLC
jgi:hypothetical protein